MLQELTPPEKQRFWIGIGLWAFFCFIGASIQFYFNVIAPSARVTAMIFVGALVAFPCCAVYMIFPRLIDRFEPEPWWALGMAFAWGLFAACGFSMVINTVMGAIGQSIGGELGIGGKLGGHIMGAVISAPLTEEFWKGLAPLGCLIFMRRQFDGKVDGFIYAAFAGLGFAVGENAMYYARGLMSGTFWYQFMLRGVLRPWNHAFYASLIGVGLGIARETTKGHIKILAPLGGFSLAVGLHAFWNAHSLILAWMGIRPGLGTTLTMTGFYILLFISWLALIVWFVVSEGRTIRSMLRDEVLIGNLNEQELALIVHPFGQWKARWGGGGALARDFVQTAIRLAMTKSHAARAYAGSKYTVSMDSIVPLRQQLAQQRQQLYAGPWRG
jgi:protease PrsW